jgi:hypothetical protein
LSRFRQTCRYRYQRPTAAVSVKIAAHWFAPEGRKRLKRIKQTVSRALDIAADQLNEISLEDIEIDQNSQHRIYQALYDMAYWSRCDANRAEPEAAPPGIPCTGFWVEDTRELILFAWNRDKAQTIVIPPEDWFLRADITVH